MGKTMKRMLAMLLAMMLMAPATGLAEEVAASMEEAVLLEEATGRNHFRIVEHDHRFFREEVGKLAEFSILRNSSARFGIYKKLRIITLRKRIACNARFGKRIIVVFYADVLYHRSFFGSAKIHFCKQKSKDERKQVACLHRETN